MMKTFSTLLAAAVLALTGALPAAAATTSFAGGAYGGSSTTATGGVLTLSQGIPLSPIGPEASVAVPFDGTGRYALTGEVRSKGPAFIGAGAGVGKLTPDGTTGTIYDAFAGVNVLPHIGVVGKVYSGFTNHVGTNTFVGLQVGL